MIHAENYFGASGAHHRALSAIADICPISVHGVGLSIGSAQGLDPDHLEAFANVVKRYQPTLVSEHLAWNAIGTVKFPDLLPLRYDDVALAVVIANIDQIQGRLGRTILIETPARYDALGQDPLTEAEFITAMAARTGCGLLLDVNNIFLTAQNLRFDPLDYLRALPLHLTGEIHLAGHDPDPLMPGLLIDTHRGPAADPVLGLYKIVLEMIGPRPTLIEWDNETPSAEILMLEAAKARDLMMQKVNQSHAA